ncbi:MAG: hypothetical protein H6653_09325 [Ardenticatenaceae bacterium]|nr:hypothetical protein [Ardenticatenaceae bacterium]
MNDSSPNLVITEIRVSHKDGGFALSPTRFEKGLNVIRGENSTGRTTLLKLFEFGLGANLKVGNFIPEVKQCEKLVLEVELNGTPYTIDRKFHGSQELVVYQGRIEDIFRPKTTLLRGEMSEFLLRRLGIPVVSVIDDYSGREKTVSFSDVYNSLHIDQVKGFSNIQANLSEKDRVILFKLLTGISIPNAYELRIKEDELTKKRADQVNELEYLNRFMDEIEISSRAEITTRLRQIDEEYVEAENQLADIKQHMQARSSYANPIREEILALEDAWANKKQDLRFSTQTLQSYHELENQLADDLDRAARVRSSVNQLSSFEFEQCPRCLQSITDNMKERELNAICSVCGRPLIEHTDDIGELNLFEEQIESQLEELAELQERYTHSIQQTKVDLEKLEVDLNEKRETLDDMMAELVSPAIDNIVVLNRTLARLDSERNQLQTQLRWHEQVNKLQENLQKVQQELETVKNQLTDIDEQERRAETKLLPFKQFFHHFYTQFFPNTVTDIVNKTYLPKIDDYDYKSKSATEKNIAILGYFYALLRFSLETTTYIPRFMVIDTLRQDNLARESYEKVLEEFCQLEDIYGKSFQLFIVVNENFEFLPHAKIALTQANRLLNVR